MLGIETILILLRYYRETSMYYEHKANKKEIGLRIAELRKLKGLSQTDLAKRLKNIPIFTSSN
jgi:hypothetical protein